MSGSIRRSVLALRKAVSESNLSINAPSRAVLLQHVPMVVTYFVIVSVISGLPTPGSCEDGEIARLFAERNTVGTMVIASLDGSTTYVHNDARAKTRFVPASTFKILNTLIALDEHAIAGDEEILKWDGKDRGIPAWNHDQTLETAFKSSCVWAYQELARRVGTDKYAAHLKKAAYGNAIAGPELTTFWLIGDLKISAVEQIEFLKKVYLKQLAYRPSSYRTLQKIMVLEQTPAYTLWAKTGWALDLPYPQVGWFVGYVAAGDKVWLFATNIDITYPEQARFRQEITMKALKLKKVLQ